MEKYKAIQVSEGVYWVGAIDWAVRDFHGYATNRGTSYNAFVVMGDEPVLIDTVKAPFANEMFARIADICDLSKIKHVISNHSEMDHSGCLPMVMQKCPIEKIYASAKGAEALVEHFGFDNVEAVSDSETRNIAGSEFTFVETRMLHWPDSMFTYYAKAKTLFSSDAFGLHLASSERFTDELPWQLIEDECAKYFANILLPFSKLITKLVERVKQLNLPLELVACDHGPIWRKDLDKIVGLYAKWAEQTPTNKAVIIYDSMWGSTAKMANAIAEGLIEGGASIKMLPLSGSHRSDAATEILDAGALLVGSPTLNQNMFPTVADSLTYLHGLQPKNLVGAAFGSYGWNCKGVGQVAEVLESMGVEMPAEKIEVKYVPTESDLENCRLLGLAVAKAMMEKLA